MDFLDTQQRPQLQRRMSELLEELELDSIAVYDRTPHSYMALSIPDRVWQIYQNQASEFSSMPCAASGPCGCWAWQVARSG